MGGASYATTATAAPACDGASTVRFSTDDFPKREQIEAWREFVGRAILKVEADPIRDRPYHADVTLRVLPNLYVTDGTGIGMQFRRSPALIDSDDLLLDMSVSGGHLARQRGREIDLAKVGAVLETVAEPLTVSLPVEDHFLVLRVPSRVISPLVGNLDTMIARPIPHGSEALQLLANYAGALRTIAALEQPGVRNLVATHIHDLIALTLGATRDATELAKSRGLRAARLRAIKADITKELGRTDLSVSEIAARHGVTPRYVQMLFEAEGTTFSEFVLADRLVRAHRMLSDPRLAGCSISSLALDAGFSDLSYFNRTFRRRFAATPSDVRAASRA